MPRSINPNPLKRLRSLLPPPPKSIMKKLHPLLKKPVRFVPFDFQRSAMEPVMQSVFKEPFEDGELGFLQGKWVRFEISDLQLDWNITLGAKGLMMAPGPVNADAVIRGALKEFVSLANQMEDPDTLFFQRRLVMEGDTELGLGVKNTMFSTEFTGFPLMLTQWLKKYMDVVEGA